MAYLDLNPVTVALRGRPEEFEMVRGNLHHSPSKHRFHFGKDGTLRVLADCDCALLATRPDEVEAFKTAFDQLHVTYWHAIEINREFAGHFRRRTDWRSVCARALTRLLAYLQPSASQVVFARESASRRAR